ncbi:glycosyltransferase family 2 protein [Betaproteobacteria bacterium SCN2]|jgi:glycosyltransferase involved in cell wall biosynthesis|nr:glycosyltransferase family 2 protein [Betaproteobacteria bacterium SCN2]
MTSLPSSHGRTRPRVAALLTAYEAGSFIQATLDALSAQACPELAILVSVDQCDDDTLALCRAHAKKDARFKVFAQTRRLGWINNSNFLLRQADADYALFAFHDDLLLPGCIEKLANELDRDPDAVLAYADLQLDRLDGSRELCTCPALDGNRDRVERAARLLAREKNWWLPAHGLFRLPLARDIGGLKHHNAGEFSADWPWLVHMSLLGTFRRVPEVLCCKTRRPDSLSPNWRFSRENWKDASAACMREIWNSRLPSDEKIALSGRFLQAMTRPRKGTHALIERIARRFCKRRNKP